ncbi:unnamed protein product [Neospora caninum Liverpool]|uniref:Rhoptry kinase family protein ROP20, putative n=1 Tax=Neospora caninum (strain Liverpool) TaxID=572307 RepID=F0VH34_NEOCL|nr:uncharacterized protein NCLIV_028170 [Neospora caninum Liverpool]CBZ53028.1 unnamed protein product [Neospora caninum Liverpool]CEL67012.1 TPA: Rhoptry kinase family protein ROP20, putative [Neospora caninum Liverpool]|eukprot:XP_003883060.1 uncharacterized protein NCLIV_028170 [Neospora caninum Liverpool]
MSVSPRAGTRSSFVEVKLRVVCAVSCRMPMASQRGFAPCGAKFRRLVFYLFIFAAALTSNLSDVLGSFISDPDFFCQHGPCRFRGEYSLWPARPRQGSTRHVISISHVKGISFLQETESSPDRPLPDPESRTKLLVSLSTGHYGQWMTADDEQGRTKLAESVSRLTRSQLLEGMSQKLMAVLDHAIPEGTDIVVEPVPGFQEGDHRVQAFRRGEALGTGSFNVVVKATPVPMPSGVSIVQRPKYALSPSLSTKFTRAVTTGAGPAAGPQAHATEGASHDAAFPPEGVALRITTARARSVMGELEAEDKCVSLVRSYESLKRKLPSGFSSEELLNKFGLAVPLMAGQIRGRPSLLRQEHNRSVVNFVQVLPVMVCDVQNVRSGDRHVATFLVKRMIQLGAFLGAAGIVHGDIKLENVLVSRTGQLFLTDFDALVRVNDLIVCGKKNTPEFSPPELVRCILDTPQEKIPATELVDAWSFGMAAWDVLCMTWPFAGMDFAARAIHNMNVLAALPEVGDDTRSLDWGRCKRRPPSAEVRAAVECLLDRNPRTRCTALDLFMSSPLFAAGRPVSPEPSPGLASEVN